MDKYISREAIIEELEEEIDTGDEFDEKDVLINKGLKIALKDIKRQPAADVQPISQWISVKDRLPDENQKCLVYRDINADLKITTGIWHSEWKVFDGLRHGTRLEDTIAWMPLPELPKDGDAK